MTTEIDTRSPSRRTFLGRAAIGACALAAGAPSAAHAIPFVAVDPAAEPDPWLGALAGKHKQFFDAVSVNEGFPLVFAWNYLNTEEETYKLRDSDLTAIVGLRHFSIPIAFTDEIWEKYKLGDWAKVMDPATKAPSTRNIFYMPKPGDSPWPDASLDKLVARGVHVTVCNVALTVLSSMLGKQAGMEPEAAKKEWTAHLIPGAVVVPSGVFAVNRAQEKGCTYCYAG